jgi:hypothetical protein
MLSDGHARQARDLMDNKQLAVDYYRRGISAMKQEDWGRAVEMFELCVRFSPSAEGYRRLLATCQEHLTAPPAPPSP